MSIEAPRTTADYEDRALDCQHALELVLSQILDDAQNAGWKSPECFDAVEALITSFRKAYDKDPDPADDPFQGAEGIAEGP